MQAIHFPFWFIKIANRDVIIDHIIIFERGNAQDTYNSLQAIAMSKWDRNSENYVYYPTDDIDKMLGVVGCLNCTTLDFL